MGKAEEELYKASKKIYYKWKIVGGGDWELLFDVWKKHCSKVGYKDMFNYSYNIFSGRIKASINKVNIKDTEIYYIEQDKRLSTGEIILPYFVNSISYLFAGLDKQNTEEYKLDLNLSGFNTENVIDMDAVFAYSNITSLNIKSFNTKNVKSMRDMFEESIILREVDLTGIEDNGIDMENIFRKTNMKIKLRQEQTRLMHKAKLNGNKVSVIEV